MVVAPVRVKWVDTIKRRKSIAHSERWDVFTSATAGSPAETGCRAVNE